MRSTDAIVTLGGIAAGVAVFAGLARLLRLRELDDVRGAIRGRPAGA
jgi:hypothetical protein